MAEAHQQEHGAPDDRDDYIFASDLNAAIMVGTAQVDMIDIQNVISNLLFNFFLHWLRIILS